MKTIIKNGKFTGTQYSDGQFTKDVQNFHKSQNETWIDKEVFNIAPDEDGEIDFGEPTVEELAEQALADWKAERQTKVDNIEVTYNEVIYQGDEVSQTRMSRAIASMDDIETIPWVAKDNSMSNLTKADLQAILKDAGTQQSVIWVTDRPEV